MPLALVFACADDPAPALSFTGTLGTPEGDATIDVQAAVGFAVDGGGALFYLASSPVTCDQLLSLVSTELYDPSDMLAGGTCNLNLTLSQPYYDAAGLTFVDSDYLGIWSLDCPIGEGSFELSNEGDYEDYYWTGSMFQGTSGTFSATLSGEGPYRVDAELGGFNGNWQGESGANWEATGSASGAFEVSVCEGLYDTNLFPK